MGDADLTAISDRTVPGDAELLRAAAEAAGIEIHDWLYQQDEVMYLNLGQSDVRGPYAPWNPLTDDGDALRLAVKLRMGLDMLGINRRVFAHAEGALSAVEEPHGDDLAAATRRAIVRAAAAMRKARES